MEISNAKAIFGLRASAGYTGAMVEGDVILGAPNTAITLTGADVAYSLRAEVNAADTMMLDVLTGTNDVLASAALTVNPTGSDNLAIFTSVAMGGAGNNITVAYATPATQATTTTAVVGNAITVTPGTKARMVVSGVTTAGVNGVFTASGVYNGKPFYTTGTTTGEDFLPGSPPPESVLYWSGGKWGLEGPSGSGYWAVVTSAAAYPDGLTGWTVGGGTGTPTVTAGISSAAQVIASVNDTAASSALVAASSSGPSTGAVAAVAAANLTGGSSGSSTSGTDLEGNAIPALATVQGILIEVATGTGTITGTASDTITYAAGDVIPIYNASGITSDIADTLTITATTETDMTITVIGSTT